MKITRTHRTNCSARGVTLIELLVALSLVGVVLAASGTMLLQSYANEATYRQQNAAQQNARTGMDIVTDDLRNAVSGTAPTAAIATSPTQTSKLFFNIPDDAGTSGGKQVSFWRHSNSADPSDTSNNNLYRQLGGGTAVVIARGVTQFTFQHASATSNRATLTVSASEGTSSVALRSDVTLRNYLTP